MKNTEDITVKTDESPVDENVTEEIEKAEEKTVRSRWIEDEEKSPAQPEKKKPFLQVPVIISLCIVAASLLAFFTYKFIFITEPEGVIWKYESESDGMDYYFEFKDGNVFKANFGSFEITTNYTKNTEDDGAKTLTIIDPSMSLEKIGCFTFGEKVKYDISGLRITSNQQMTLTGKGEDEEPVVLNQSEPWECPLDTPEDFKEDENLTGEWVNVFSSDSAKQTLEFNDDGSLTLTATYKFSGGQFTEITRYCTYTVEKNEINIIWYGKDKVVHNTQYSIKDGILQLEGSYFYRAGNNPATPDQAQKQVIQ